MVVEFHENQGGIFIKIMRTNPANPIHNIRMILPGFEDRHELFPFYPAFLEDIQRYGELRFMDFFHTNAHVVNNQLTLSGSVFISYRLTFSQTDFRLSQTERACRRQF